MKFCRGAKHIQIYTLLIHSSVYGFLWRYNTYLAEFWIVPLSSEYSARGIEFSFLHFKQKMQYILGFYPAITALGIRESEIQHPATPSHENHEFCKQHGPEPRFPGHRV